MPKGNFDTEVVASLQKLGTFLLNKNFQKLLELKILLIKVVLLHREYNLEQHTCS